jgi:hypothetical protein
MVGPLPLDTRHDPECPRASVGYTRPTLRSGVRRFGFIDQSTQDRNPQADGIAKAICNFLAYTNSSRPTSRSRRRRDPTNRKDLNPCPVASAAS